MNIRGWEVEKGHLTIGFTSNNVEKMTDPTLFSRLTPSQALTY